jgi:asparagine synthase (glutamine-hydrolysing)
MCGICGVVHLDGSDVSARVVEQMTAHLVHRGPDQGAVVAAGRAVLGNRRLAIQDLSPAGALPMQSADGALALAFNGEIYNFPVLRRQLEAAGERFLSRSDAEAVLKLYRRHGIGMLQHLRGMFAIGLWDAENRSLLLARDRLGEKPLYYYCDAHLLAFASEIKALLAHPDIPRRSALDADGLALYLAYGYMPTPLTAFHGIRSLPPGGWLTLKDGILHEGLYWEPPHNAVANPSADRVSERDAIRAALDEAVQQALISDVPLGAFLSGGLDSSLIAALMRRHSNGVVRTFSIGFEGDASFDETPYARRVAQHLGTEHIAFTVQPQTLDLLPKLVWHHDQPFGDSSAIPTYLVSRLAREHVTVALTGDGGDELFGGYDRFRAALMMEDLRVVPRPILAAAAALLDVLPESTRYHGRVRRVHRFLHGAAQPPLLAYFDWVRLFSAELSSELLHHAQDVAGAHFAAGGIRRGVEGLLDKNLRTYLPDDLLIKVDRSGMAASLETRAPFLDHRLVERAASVPINLRLNRSTGKIILKDIAREYLPDDIVDRRKHGFGVPLGAWMRRSIDFVCETLLSREAVARGLFDQRAIELLIDEHLEGRRDHAQRLWALMTLEWWHRLFIDPVQLVAP